MSTETVKQKNALWRDGRFGAIAPVVALAMRLLRIGGSGMSTHYETTLHRIEGCGVGHKQLRMCSISRALASLKLEYQSDFGAHPNWRAVKFVWMVAPF